MNDSPNPLDPAGPHGELLELTLGQLAGRLRTRKLSCLELVNAYLERIEAIDGRDGLNAFLTVAAEEAQREARRMDELLDEGTILGPLHGLPIAVKDNLATAGLATTAGSRVLKDHVPRKDAAVVARLKAAGAIVLGKTNMHEFAFGITNNNPFYGPARNPYDPTRIPGGSSGGSAGAVAAGLCAAALGTDTGGSIRIPSALCGCVGLKPTNLRVPRNGLLCLSLTCDCIGPITRSTDGADVLLQVIAGEIEGEPKSPNGRLDGRQRRANSGWRGVRLGVPRRYFYDDLDQEVEQQLSAALRDMQSAGAELVDLEIRGVEQIVEPGYAIVLPEAVYLIGRYMQQLERPLSWEAVLAGMSESIRDVFRRQLRRDSAYLGHEYLRAVRDFRPRLRDKVSAALERVDALVVATTPLPAARIGEDDSIVLNGRRVDTFETYFRNTFFANLTGLPAITVPVGLTSAGLPVGMQFVAEPWADRELIGLARMWENLAS